MNYRRKILVVDDSQVNRMIVSKILSDTFDIIEAEDGLDALDILAREADSISLIILDIVMPIMDGYGFLECYSSIPQAGGIPVIVATQMDSDEDEVNALAAGAADFITKPYKPDIIRHRVTNIIKLRETASFINTIERDMLTSLYTKEAFYTRANTLMSHDPTALFDIVCVDIENFRMVNDLYGEGEGDKLLCTMAESLDVIVGSVGGIVGRITADVFIAIMPVLDQLQWQEFVDEFQSKLKDSSMPTRVQVKYGVYRTIDRSISIRAMCDRAQQALHSIKGKYGVAIAYYDDAMGELRKFELELTADMKQALTEGQFKVYYQPKYDLNTEGIVGAEALVRWLHPKMGLLSPGSFIPVFEANGFISQLDYYVWECVCQNLNKWMHAGRELLPVSVNVSRIDIYNEDLPALLCGLLKKYQIPANLLHLEITETAYVKNQQQLARMISSLKKEGFVVEMDDFGSGFSSLTMLTEIPVDVIKLDNSLIANRKKSDRSTSVLRFIINLARELGVPVIAEGIETRDDLNYLKALKCKYGQGYFFAKPGPAESYEKLLLCSELDSGRVIKKAPPAELALGLADVFGELPCGLASFGLEDGELITCNNMFAKLVGIADVQKLITAQPFIETLFVPEFRKTCKDMMEKLKTKVMSSAEAFGVVPERHDGEVLQCTLLLRSAIVYGRNVVIALLSHFSGDFPSSESYSDLKGIIGNMPGALMKFSAEDHRITFISEAFGEMTGYSGEEAILKFDSSYDKMIFREDRELTLASMSEQLNMYGEAVCDHRIELSDGGTQWFTVKTRVLCEAGERWCYSIINKKLEQPISHANNFSTHIDNLTGLLDKTAFELAAKERLAANSANNLLVTLDLDNFSMVNEKSGNVHCDELLRSVARLLRKEFRKNDIIGRIEDDEFAVLVTQISALSDVKERMNTICKRMIAQTGVSCSMGVAISNEGASFEVLLDRASSAMKEIKNGKKNGCAIYDENKA